MEALRKRHGQECDFVENQIRQLSKPKLGRKPLVGTQLAEKSAALRAEVAARHAEEVDKLHADIDAGRVTDSSEGGGPQGEAAGASPPSGPLAASLKGGAPHPGLDAQNEEHGDGSGVKLSRRQRRQLALEQEAEGEGAGEPHAPSGGKDRKAEEHAALSRELSPLGLAVHPVPADGNCLFSAVSDQLVGVVGTASASSMGGLRARAGGYIKAHWADFAPFLPYEESDGYDGSEEQSKAAVTAYADRVERSASWGGHPELRALAATLGLPIIVYRAEGEPLVFGPDGSEGGGTGQGRTSALRLTFHRYYLTAGEHYNSVRPSRAGPGGTALGRDS